MPIYLGQSSSSRLTPRRVLVWQSAALIALLLSLLPRVVRAQRMPQGFMVDLDTKRIVLLPTLPSDWSICDGPTGACVSVRSLRQATAMRDGGR